jgi:hypothetical protein
MDVVTYGADATQFFDVHQKMVSSAERTSSALGSTRGAEGFLRSERIVARSSANIVSGLFQAQNSAEALAHTFLNIEHATRFGLGAAIGLAVGVALFESLKRAKDKAYELNEEIRGVLASASGPASYSSLEALSEKLKAIREEQKKTQAEAGGAFGSLGSAVAAHPNLTPWAAVRAQNAERTARESALRASELDTLNKITQKMKEAADLESMRLHFSEATAALYKEEAEYIEKRAALIRGPGQNLQAVAQLDRLHASTVTKLKSQNSAENDSLSHARELADIERRGLGKRDEMIAKLSSELAYRVSILKAAQKLGEIKGIAAANVGVAGALGPVESARKQFFQDVGSGAILKQFAQEAIDEAQRKAGEALVAELRQARTDRVALGPNALKILDEADKLDKSREEGLKALAGQDFSGLAALGNLPFSGLQSLNNLTITVQ